MCSVISIGEKVWEDTKSRCLTQNVKANLLSLGGVGVGPQAIRQNIFEPWLRYCPAKWAENIGAKWGENEAKVLEIHFKKLGPIGALQAMGLSANSCQGWENANVIGTKFLSASPLFAPLVRCTDGYLSVNYQLMLKQPTAHPVLNIWKTQMAFGPIGWFLPMMMLMLKLYILKVHWSRADFF